MGQISVEIYEPAGSVLSGNQQYITYSLTNACNFRCSYCYQEHSKNALDEKNFEKTFLYVERELKNYDRLMVHWFGGEPLLRLKWLTSASERLTRICEQLGKPYYAGITTNGSLFSKQTASLLKKNGVKQVQFSLDGEQEIHNTLRLHKNGKGTYESVMTAIQNAIDEEFTIFLRINLSLRAVGAFEDLVADLKQRGFDESKLFVYINEMKQHSNSMNGGGIYFQSVAEYAEDFVRCLRVLKRHGYSLPRIEPVDVNCAFDKPSSVLFGVDGNLYHCTTGTDRALGELNVNGELAASSSRRDAIHSREPWDDPHCTNCKSLPTCMGGCAYLDEEGKTKCNPEGFVVEQLLRTHLNTTQ